MARQRVFKVKGAMPGEAVAAMIFRICRGSVRVLHFYKAYLPDSFAGGERVIYEICEATAPHGIHSNVLSLTRGPTTGPVSIGTHTAYKAHLDLEIASNSMSLGALQTFSRLKREVDLIHYHFPWPFMDLVHFATRVRLPTLVTYHSDIVRQSGLLKYYRPLMRAFLDSVDHLVATSPNYLETSPILQHYAAKTSVVPIALSDRKSSESAERRDHYGRRFPGPFLLFVGALRYYKGLEHLIKAARLVDFPIVLAGDGELADVLDRTAPPNVHLLGSITDEDRNILLSMCTGFVFPSHLRSEAFGIALLEAAMAGKAMISCEIGTGTSYINVDGLTGLVVPPADAVLLADAMRALVGDPDMARRMGEQARQRATATFNAERMGADYAHLYRTIVAHRRSGGTVMPINVPQLATAVAERQVALTFGGYD